MLITHSPHPVLLVRVWSATASYRSLDAIMERLVGMAEQAVVVQFIDPSDRYIQQLGHIAINR